MRLFSYLPVKGPDHEDRLGLCLDGWGRAVEMLLRTFSSMGSNLESVHVTVGDPAADTVRGLFEKLLSTFQAHHKDDHVVRDAFELAHRAHAGQHRTSGEPYITHPIAVALILAEYGLDSTTVAAALLHDVVEDTDTSIADLRSSLGDDVADIVDGVTKLDQCHFTSKEHQQAAALRKLVIAMSKDVRVLLVKLADRLHNVRTLEALDEDRRIRIATETLEVYAPLAHRLGVQDIKHELEDSCFRVLHPARFKEVDAMIAARAPSRDSVIMQTLEELLASFLDAGLVVEVSGRPKRHYSIYRKMVNSGLPFEEIHDLIGVRIITASTSDCYAALGVAHAVYQPLHGRFKDYVAMPKFNLYQSLHTTVIGPDGHALEVQIRSRAMHDLAEYGIAAHWRYKEDSRIGGDSWMADLGNLESRQADPAEFLRSLKLDLYRDEVFAVTPAGDIKTLPQGSTPIDFAYAIHTEIGNSCVGARVNGRLVSLDTPLRSGDVIEILTSRRPGAAPSKDWLRFASTSRAKHGVRQWFQRERRSAFLEPGRAALMEAVGAQRLGLDPDAVEAVLPAVASELGFRGPESLIVAIGEGGLSAAAVASQALRHPSLDGTCEVPQIKPEEGPAPVGSAPLVAEGLEDLQVRLAGCCSPEPGDPVIGFISAGRGVSAHRVDCLNVGPLDPAQLVELVWEHGGVPRGEASVVLEALDRTGLLGEIASVIAEFGGYIADAGVKAEHGVVRMSFRLRVIDDEQAESILVAISSLTGVFEVSRSSR